MDNAQRAIMEGREANDLLESAAFKRATESLRQAIMDKWANSPIRDVEGQHELRLMVKLLDDLIGNLKQAVFDGTFTEKDLEIKRSAVDAIRRAAKAL